MKSGFTIVELLIVIVVIAILAAVTIVGYTGISNRATEASLKSDLRNTVTKLSILTIGGVYPQDISDADKVESATTKLDYQRTEQGFCLQATTKATNGPSFFITHAGTIQTGSCPPTAPVWASVAAGSNYTLATTSKGVAYGWGQNTYGQLGKGDSGTSTTPVKVTDTGVLAGKVIKKLSGGDGHTLALDTEGKVYSWGRDNNGQLGDGTTGSRVLPYAVTDTLASKTVTDIAAAGNYSLALTSDGQVYAWGDNSGGQLGEATTTARRLVPTLVAGGLSGRTITTIAAGYYHVLAVDSTGKVYAWGSNNYGQVGDATTTNRATPTAISAITGSKLLGKTVTKVAAGFYHSLALTSEGKLVVWGYNPYGQLGLGSIATPRSTPEEVAGTAFGGKTLTSISANSMQSYAVTTDGTLYAWGRNQTNQLGDSTTTAVRSTPFVASYGTLSGKTVTQAVAGSSHGLALTNDGTLHGWGDNGSGQVGDGTTTQQSVPVSLAMPQ